MLRSLAGSSLRCSYARRQLDLGTGTAYRSVSSSARRSTGPDHATTAEKGKQRAVDVADASAADASLPFLQRPLGVRSKPNTRTKTWADTKDKFLDQDKRLEERSHLAREVTRGHFSDLSATRKNGGKTWIAPKVLIREDKALYFPDIVGTPLNAEQKVHTTNLLANKVSVVALLTTRISELQTAQFVELTQAAFASNPDYQYVQINLQDNLLKSLLVSLFASGIRKTVPKDLWGTYMISSQNMEYLRQPLGIANRHVGYVYLVDTNLKVRWAACADPKSEEVHALKSCADVLLGRVAKARAGEVAEPVRDAAQSEASV